MATNNHSLFSVFGIEIEYMLVDKTTLSIQPIADEVIKSISGAYTNEIDRGNIAINNELALHVLELKTNGPVKTLKGLDLLFADEVKEINNTLETFSAQLMPTGMHPLLKPETNMKLWPHGNKDIYHAYHKIFNCQGHGWTNLQSVHINLPFANDEEFVKLHSAIRLLMPLIPALIASTPLKEGKSGTSLSTRLTHYEQNQKKIPIITGSVIPEFIPSTEAYHETILKPMYHKISEYDEQGVLQEEWLNSRGAIARFDRSAIEIRIVDSQESPLADIAVVSAIVQVLKHLVATSFEFYQNPISHLELKKIYDYVLYAKEDAPLDFTDYLNQLGIEHSNPTIKSVWEKLLERACGDIDIRYQNVLENIISNGSLAKRILTKLSDSYHEESIKDVYQQLCECLAANQMFK